MGAGSAATRGEVGGRSATSVVAPTMNSTKIAMPTGRLPRQYVSSRGKKANKKKENRRTDSFSSGVPFILLDVRPKVSERNRKLVVQFLKRVRKEKGTRGLVFFWGGRASKSFLGRRGAHFDRDLVCFLFDSGICLSVFQLDLDTGTVAR